MFIAIFPFKLNVFPEDLISEAAASDKINVSRIRSFGGIIASIIITYTVGKTRHCNYPTS